MSTEFTDRIIKSIHDRAYPGVLNELVDLARYALAQQESARYEGQLDTARTRLTNAERQQFEYSAEYDVISDAAAAAKAEYLNNRDETQKLDLRDKYNASYRRHQEAQVEKSRRDGAVRSAQADIERLERVIAACETIPLPDAPLLRAALNVLEQSADTAPMWVELAPVETK